MKQGWPLVLLLCSCTGSKPAGAPPGQTPLDADRAPVSDAAAAQPPTSIDAHVDDARPPAADAVAADSSSATPSRRDAFLTLLRGIVPSLPALDPQLAPPANAGALLQQDFTIASTPAWRTQGTLRKGAAAGRLPVVICLHETGADRDSPGVVQLATALAGRGFLTVAISGRYFGKGGGNDDYVAAMKAAYARPGQDYPFLYDTVWDVMRLIDYLVTRDDVDPARIGLLGISKGGMETFLAAAADPRVAAAAPIIGVQSFKWGLEHDAFQDRAESLGGAVTDPASAAAVKQFYDRVAPGLVDAYDGPDMLPLIAPRPLLVLNGLRDPRNAMVGVHLAVDAARVAYQAAGAADKLELFAPDVGHDGGYPPFHDRAIAWMVRWLAPPR